MTKAISFLQLHHRKLFYFFWALLSLIQAAGTGLFDDEAYYWVYSRFPDWGYFDHPPMIGIVIRAGYYLFNNELGVRLLIVTMSTITVLAIDSLIEKRNDRLFYGIVLSIGLLQIGSIIAVPDVPLLFFTALFFLSYRRFCDKPSLLHAVVLGAVAALMLYSKYHGVLVIFFTLLSNLRLLSKPATWLAGLVALLLFSPHLLWQYNHDFISVQYHLFERNATDYQLAFTVEYILGQLLLAGPLIGWLLLWASARYKTGSATERALQWTFAGVYLLFFVSTFKGRTEANWTVPAMIAVIVLSHQYLNTRPKQARWVVRLMLPSLVLILAVRVYMLLDISPLPWLKKDEFHKNRVWAEMVHQKAAGRPVVFPNSYQRASQYWFYSGDTSFALNNIFYRRNNYNFWPVEHRLQQKDVLLVSGEQFAVFSELIENPRKKIWAYQADSFFSFSQIRIYGPSVMRANAGTLEANLEFIIPPSTRVSPSISSHDTATISLVLYYHDNDPALIIPSNLNLKSILAGDVTVKMNIPVSVPKGKIRARWGISSCVPGLPTLNSISYVLEVE